LYSALYECSFCLLSPLDSLNESPRSSSLFHLISTFHINPSACPCWRS
jgi:hypothetical protein